MWAFVDPALLRVVLGNLIGNALDVLAAKADAKPGTVRISLDASEHQAKLRVVDDGPGIPAALRGHLFEPFQTTKPSGTGLGLAIVAKIIEQHGGKVDLVDAEPDENGRIGACFTFTLPARRAGEAEEGEPAAPEMVAEQHAATQVTDDAAGGAKPDSGQQEEPQLQAVDNT